MIVVGVLISALLVAFLGGWGLYGLLHLVGSDVDYWPCVAIVGATGTAALYALRHAE